MGDTSEAMNEGVGWIMSPEAKMGECKEKEVWGELKPGPDARGQMPAAGVPTPLAARDSRHGGRSRLCLGLRGGHAGGGWRMLAPHVNS